MTNNNLALPLLMPEKPALAPAANTEPVAQSDELWLCIYLPYFALHVLALDDLLQQAEQRAPQIVLDEVAGRWLVHSVCDMAEASGIVPGMAVNAAYALRPDLQTHRRDQKLETGSLKRLADWAYQFTPQVSIAEPQSLLLEIRGSLTLFGGLENLLQQIERELRDNWQYLPQMAVTPTPLASQMLARAGQSMIIDTTEDLRSVLGDLSIYDLLLDDPKLIKKLNNIGVRNLKDLWRLPRDGVARRFGHGLMNHLDKLLGTVADPRRQHEVPTVFDASIELPFEAADNKAVLFASEKLLDQLETFLRLRDAGIHELLLRLYHFDHPPESLSFGFRQNTRDATHMFALLRERLDRLASPGPVSEVRIIVKHIAAFVAETHGLFPPQTLPVFNDNGAHGSHQRFDPSWNITLEQLQNRFGKKAVQYIQAENDHRPEYAWSYQDDYVTQTNETSPTRPVWLLPEPQQLIARNGMPWQNGPLFILSGPERIESGWWDGRDVCRDYYVAISTDKRRLWIFRDLRNPAFWYLHGLFG